MQENQNKTVTLKKKKTSIKRINSMENSTRVASQAYAKMDYYEEKIFMMRSQVLKNLHLLDNSHFLLNSFKDMNEDFMENQNERGTINIKRNVLVKQYAQETFKRIRLTHNISDEEFY